MHTQVAAAAYTPSSESHGALLLSAAGDSLAIAGDSLAIAGESEVGGACGQQSSLRTVGAPHTEVHQQLAGRHQYRPGSFRRDDRLKLQDVDQSGFN